MTIRTTLLGAAAAIAIVVPAAAFADEGFYLGANLGVNMPGNSKYEDSTGEASVDTNLGFSGAVSAGYQFQSNWRLQADLAARINSVDEITGTGATSPFDGNVDAYSLLADAIYGIPTGTKFTPYIGAGLGLAVVKARNVQTVLGTNVNDTDVVFAYQGIAGIEYDISPTWKASLDYKYLRTADPKFEADNASEVKTDYEDHTVTVGLRYLFPAALPPAEPPAPAPVAEPAPPPPPSVPNNYILFFDFDRSNLSADADRILAAAASNAQQARATTIEVSGHTDRSGSDRYNMRLSQRRADVVKKALLARGIPAEEIVVTAAGESSPLVPTANGVREAQNRRVQILLK